MPIPTAKAYGAMAAAAHGKGRLGIPQAVAREMLSETPAEKRSQFARANARGRKRLKRKTQAAKAATSVATTHQRRRLRRRKR